MRIDARELLDNAHWRVYDASQGNVMLLDVVWVDDETQQYAILAGPLPLELAVVDAPKVIISTGLRIVWVNVKQEQLKEERDENAQTTIQA